ncbi:MAG: S-layer family protein, partial [Thermomicrobiales bacterium]|nr:S-layer family protein [Thermomicrobiales bacterium]
MRRLSAFLAVLVTVSMLAMPFVSAQDIASTPVSAPADPPAEAATEEATVEVEESTTEAPVIVTETAEPTAVPTALPTEDVDTDSASVPDEVESDSPSLNAMAVEEGTPGITTRTVSLHFQLPNGSPAPNVDFVLYCSGPDTQIRLGSYTSDEEGGATVQVDTPAECSFTESFWNVEIGSSGDYTFSWHNFDQGEPDLIVTVTQKPLVTFAVTLNGGPFANGQVEIFNRNWDGSFTRLYGLGLDEAGARSFRLPAGDYRVEVPAGPLTPAAHQDFTVGTADINVVVPLVFTNYAVTFSVTAPDSVTTLYLRIYDDNGNDIDRTISIGEATTVAGLVPGHYTFTIDGDTTMTPYNGEFTLVDEDIELDPIVITPIQLNDITITINTDTSNSHVGTLVSLTTADDSLTVYEFVDEGNMASFTGLPTGQYHLYVYHFGVWNNIDTQIQVSPESTTFSFTPGLNPNFGRIRIQLVTERPEGIPQQYVCLRDQATSGNMWESCEMPGDDGGITYYPPVDDTYLLTSPAYQYFGALYEAFTVSEGNLYFDREVVWPERNVYAVDFTADLADSPYGQSLDLEVRDAASNEVVGQASLYNGETFTFYLAAGNYAYTYIADTYVAHTTPAEFTVDATGHSPITIQPVPLPQQSFTIKIVPSSPDDISGTRVCMYLPPVNYCQMLGTDNQVTFDGLIPGVYEVFLDNWGAYSYQYDHVTVGETPSPYTINWERSGEVVPVSFTLSTSDSLPTTAIVWVMDEWGNTVATLDPINTGDTISVPLVSGQYSYNVGGSGDYHDQYGVSLVVGDDPLAVDILLESSVVPFGIVSVLVDFPEDGPGEPVSIWFTNIATHVEDGPYRLSEEYPYPVDLAAGTYTWRAEGVWYYPVTSTEPITILRDQTTDIAFSVQLKSTGAAQLNITMVPVPTNYYERAICIRSTVDNWSRCDNYFIGQAIFLDDLPEGQYNVYVPTWRLYQYQQVPVTVVAGETTQVDIDWIAVEGTEVTFNMVWPAGEPELDVTVSIYYEDGINGDSVQFWPGVTSVTAELPYGTHTYSYYIYGYENAGEGVFTVTEGGDNTVTISPTLPEGGAKVSFHIEPSRPGDSLEGAYTCLYGWMGSRCVRVDANNDANFGTMPADYYQLELNWFEDYAYVYPAAEVEVTDGGGDIHETVTWQAPSVGSITFNITLPESDDYNYEYIVNLWDENGNSVEGFYANQPGTNSFSVTVPGGNYSWTGSGYMLKSLSGDIVVDDGGDEIINVEPLVVEMGRVQFNVTMPEGENQAEIYLSVRDQSGNEIASMAVSSDGSLDLEVGTYSYEYLGLGIAFQGPFDFEIVANQTTEINIAPQFDDGLPLVTLVASPSVPGDSLENAEFCLYFQDRYYHRCGQLDEAGRFVFGHLPPGEYELNMWMIDSLYDWQWFDVTVPGNVAEHEIAVTMQKTPGARVTFAPQLPEGIDYLYINLIDENDNQVTSFTTWGDNYSLDLPVGTYSFTLDGANAVASGGSFVVRDGENLTVPLVPERIPGSFVQIKVTSSEGYYIAWNQVCLGTPDTGFSDCFSIQGDGIADLGYMPAGQSAITLTDGGLLHPDQVETINVLADGGHHEFEFIWQAVAAEVVTFTATVPEISGYVYLEIWTSPPDDQDGVFAGYLEFTESGSKTILLPAGDYTYNVSSGYHYPQNNIGFSVVEGAENSITVPELVPLPTFTIHLMGEQNVPLAGYMVCIGQEEWNQMCQSTDAQGNATFWPDAGTWWIRVDPYGVYSGTTVTGIEVGSTNLIQNISLVKIAEYGAVSINTSAVQEDIPEIRIIFENQESGDWFSTVISQGDVTTIELPVGTFTWHAWIVPYNEDYFEQTGSVTIVDQGSETLTLPAFSQKPLVSIRVVDALGQPISEPRYYIEGVDDYRYGRGDSSGMIQVHVVPGDYLVSLWDQNAEVYRLISIHADENGYDGQITLVAHPVSLSLGATSGKAGSTVTLTGSGFVANSTVDISFGGTLVTTTTASSGGTISVTLTIPVTSTVQTYAIAAMGGGDRTGVASFSVTALADVTATINAPTGQAGKSYTMSGSGFLPGQQVTIRWNADDGTQLATLTPTSGGAISGSITIPVTVGKGIYTLYVTSASGQSTTVAFEVVTLADVSATISSPTGQAGKSYTLNGTGFLPGQQVTVRWNAANGTQLATLTPTSEGAISGSITIPVTVAKGTYTLYVTSASGQSTTVSFEVVTLADVSASISAPTGQAGKSYTLSGTGFLPGQQVTVRWNSANGAQLATLNPSSTGGISGSITIPVTAAKGTYTLYVGSVSGQSTTVTFEVVTLADVTATISSPTGQAGKSYTLSGTGFLPGQDVTVRWNAANGTQLATLNPSSTGEISGSITIPVTAAKGTYTLYVGSVSGQSTTVTFEVVTLADVSATINSPTGQAGKSYTINGSGFLPGQQVTVRWNAANGTQLATMTPTSGGAISGSITIPVTVGKGIYTLYVTSASGQSTTVAFEVVTLADVTATISSPTGQAGKSYTVNGSGFLPGQQVTVRWNAANGTQLATLTPTSEGAISGSITIPVAAAKGTYTLYISSASGQSTTVSFSVITLADVSASISAPTGQAGKSYTVSGDGFLPGQNVTVRWNAANGTQLATLAPTSTGHISGSITIPVTAAKGSYTLYVTNASGQSTTVTFTVNQLADVTITLSPTSGQAGTVTKVSGSGFQPGEAITVRWGGSSGTVLRTFNAGTTGKFTANITVPATSAKQAYVVYVSAASGQTGSATYTVTQVVSASITLSPTSGQAGTVTKVSGTGFQPGEAITIRWGGSAGTVLRTFNAGTTGKFTANITVPA